MTARSDRVLYYGDNLEVMRLHVADDSVDLIYLDPPFNSKATYNVLFETKDGTAAPAQIKAFEDTWHWDLAAADQFHEVLTQGGRVADALRAFETLLGRNDMLAYLTMMAPRLVEMRRVLKQTGSIYLHCDPTASHYLKILMDAVFDTNGFRSEVIWKRTGSSGAAKRWGPIHDIIFYYSKSTKRIWNTVYQAYDQKYIDSHFTTVEEKTGRRYQGVALTGPGPRDGASGDEWGGHNPTDGGRHWQPSPYLYEKYEEKFGEKLDKLPLLERLDKFNEAGMIHWPKKKGGIPRYKLFLDEAPGVKGQDVWTDIDPINSQAQERLDYPTQKPLALLERIIQASSNEGDVVMDPFCGCGTAIVAAEKLKRKWIGIDITHLAIGLMRHRLFDQLGDNIDLTVTGEPTSLPGAIELAKHDKYQFQWWALGKVGARPAKEDQKKGADGGIDGRLYFEDDGKKTKQILISVKGGQKIGLKDVKELAWTVQANKAQIGVLISIAKPTKPMRREVTNAGFYETPWGRFPTIQLLTVEDLFKGTHIEYPGRGTHDVTHRKAPSLKTEKEQGKLGI